MKLSILMVALRNRRQLRKQVEIPLRSQVSRYRDVEFLIDEDNGRHTSGHKRNRLVQRSTGEYFSFVDDDDLVANDYVERLYKGCLTGVPVVTFWLERIGNDRPRQVHDLSIRYHDKQRLPNGHIGMSANHLCAWRRDIGTMVQFADNLGYNDDRFWYTPLLASGLANTEHRISKVLYTYRFHLLQTVNQQGAIVRHTYHWAKGGVECFWQGDEIVIAVAGRHQLGNKPTLWVRDRHGGRHNVARRSLRRLCTVTAR